MICPSCKKLETKIEKEIYDSSLNSIKRQRLCHCGYLFVSYEINKDELKSKTAKILKNSLKTKKIRKLTIKEEWLDFRIFLYGLYRIIELKKTIDYCSKEFDKKFKSPKKPFMGPVKWKNRKSYFMIYDKEREKDFIEVRLEGVKETIKKCIMNKTYWEQKSKFFPDILKPDFKNRDFMEKKFKNLIAKESQEYFRSVTSNVHKNKYNNQFYINSIYLKKLTSVLSKQDLEEITYEDIRDYIFGPQNWSWYEAVR